LIFYYENNVDISDESKVPVLIEPKVEKKKGDVGIKVEGKKKGALFKKVKGEPSTSMDTTSTSMVSMYTLCSTFLTILDLESRRN
jgi:hypothetical protein